jgi:hypothetical protein
MSFTQPTFAPVGPQSSDAPAVYSYSTSDTLATVKGAGYFVDKENQLEEGDIVFTQSSDGFTIMEVSASTGTVTDPGFGGPLNEILINTEADLPNQTATTFTTSTGFAYRFGSHITSDKRLIAEPNSAVIGPSPNIPAYTYTGTSPCITATTRFNMNNFNFSCPSAPAFDHQGTGFVILNAVVCPNAGSLGTIAGGRMTILDSLIVTGGGMLWSGVDNQFFTTNSSIIATGAFDVLDLDTATFTDFRTSETGITGPVGAVALTGAAGSANIQAGFLGQINLCNFTTGGITPISGIDEQDVRWRVSASPGLSTSRNAADVHLAGGTASITPVVAGSWYEVGVPTGGVSWVGDVLSRFTVGTDGALTYIGEEDIEINILGRSTIEKASGGADVLEVRIAKNWAGIADGGEIKSRGTTQDNAPNQVITSALISLTTGDTVRQIYTNQDNNVGINVSVAYLEAV